MLTSMIEAHSLTKHYGDRVVVRDVSFTCEPGTVTGFLGLNGAGKSTTLKMLCGLTPISSGHASVLGAPYSRHPNPGRSIGVLIDASAQHAGRRGQEVLGVSAQLLGVEPARVDQLLELVGLDRAAARKRVGQYSLGMRQRLGIAHALLGDPEVLILDEPANGLDPDGMRWMRGLLRDFAQRGGTVLLSSHLLHEIEAIADRLAIISAGRIVAQGSREDLLAGMSSTLARAADGRGLQAALELAGITVTTTPDGGVLADAEPDQVGTIANDAGIALRELRADGDSSLEQLFFSLTATGGETHRELEEVA
jgi:ABC-2 type transport system ATP-binding protein